MPDFYVVIKIDTATFSQAEKVARERTGYDEDLGFPYKIEAMGMALGVGSLFDFVQHLTTGHDGNGGE